MMNIIQKIVPESRSCRLKRAMIPRYITIHNTANTSRGANALAHANYLLSGNSKIVGWHYTVDDKNIVQHIPTNEMAFHAGDGRYGTGNTQSIGIEICQNADGNYAKAESNAIDLVIYLMKKHNISIERVVPHKHWSGKQCPRKILDRWPAFINEVKRRMAAKVQPKTQAKVETVVTRYKIQRGDTLSEIAVRHGVELADLLKANSQIKNPSLIYVGQLIVIPKGKPTHKDYTIKAGDTLWGIATANKISVDKLMKANPQIKNASLIRPGDVIKIPLN
ncbi:LysM peptidoglycan-binding domain-containing protein [Fredinandcohnia humi]